MGLLEDALILCQCITVLMTHLLFFLELGKKCDCWMQMVSTGGHATRKHRRPRPHIEFCSCQWGCFEFQHVVLRCRALATHRDRLGRGLVGCMSFVHDVCVWMKEKAREEEGTDRQLGLAVSCHSVLITASLVSKPRSFGFSKLLHASGTVLEASWMSVWERDCKGKAQRESRNEARVHFPRCSWLLSAPKDLSKNFQNKEIVCVGAQIANPRIYAHLHIDRDTLTHWDIKKCYSNSF